MPFDIATNIIGRNSALMHKKAFILEQTPPTLPSGVGKTEVLVMRSVISHYSPMPFKSLLLLEQHIDPPPSRIGEEDLPGGLKKSNIISGKAAPLYDLAQGIVQIDDVNVFFDVLA
ncbi:MAG: hypothetical protein HOC71_06395 [Candidatus Latescibacteria bacterium]|jgi:hypothetical protein|nr:hypothetical protein [Candidatus Latescibacterota bacterium]